MIGRGSFEREGGSGEVVSDARKDLVLGHDFGPVMAPRAHKGFDAAVDEVLDGVKREIFRIVGGGGELRHERRCVT